MLLGDEHMFRRLMAESQTNIPKDFIASADIISKFLFTDKVKYFVIGKNDQTIRLNNLMPICAIIDDNMELNGHYNGIPLIKMVDVDRDAFIINCSFSISTIDVITKFSSLGFKNVINYCELSQYDAEKFPLPQFVIDFQKEFEVMEDILIEIYDQLEDSKSKEVFNDIARYRLSANPAHMRSYFIHIKEQYIEKFMNYNSEFFVDAGGFDGDTSEIFAKNCPNYRWIYFIEPSKNNLTYAKKRLVDIDRISYFPIGLSNQREILRFNENLGSASNVSDIGSVFIQLDRLDAIIQDEISFIKMDLEGFELKALEGSIEILKKYKPKLAIAVYHAASDLREIYQFIKSLNLGYKMYMRHYTQGWSETILYFTH